MAVQRDSLFSDEDIVLWPFRGISCFVARTEFYNLRKSPTLFHHISFHATFIFQGVCHLRSSNFRSLYFRSWFFKNMSFRKLNFMNLNFRSLYFRSFNFRSFNFRSLNFGSLYYRSLNLVFCISGVWILKFEFQGYVFYEFLF